MKWKSLQDKIAKLNAEQLEQDVTVFYGAIDEYFKVSTLYIEPETDILEQGHAVLAF